jgi:hypothetical protein
VNSNPGSKIAKLQHHNFLFFRRFNLENASHKIYVFLRKGISPWSAVFKIYFIYNLYFLGLKLRDDKQCKDFPLDATLSDDLVDATLSDAAKADLKSWQNHDESKNDFCDVHSETCEGCDYIDLTINPERFTGYSGEASR